MFDLNAFITLVDDIERKRTVRPVAPAANSMPSISRQKPGRKPNRGSRQMEAGSDGLPAIGGRPWTGPAAPQGALEDEMRRRGSGTAGNKPSANGLRFEKRTGEVAVDRSSAQLPPGRSVGGRIALASGSQPAVVKLVSFAAGRARVGKLLAYQSRGGELSVENEAGATSGGRDWIGQLAEDWSEVDGREPSKDVLRLSMTVDASRFDDDEAIGEALKATLAGHRIAWRSAAAGSTGSGERREIEMVVSAARRRLPGEEKAGRIYDNRKSLRNLDDRLMAAFGPDTAIDVHGFGHGVEGAARYLGQLRKGGSERVVANRMDKAGQLLGDRVLDGDRSALDEAKDWKRDLRSQERRDVAHIVLSARPGTPKAAFVDAARAMLVREFEGHRYLFTMHEDRRHIHVHAVVKMLPETGVRLHPKIEDLRRWRKTIAEEARERVIPMDAVSRFERANPPGYKMKDIRRVERGEASANTRRRVEAVRNGTIHIPSRDEGRRHAQAAAHGWNGEAERGAATQHRQEPPRHPGIVRLYRAERQDTPSSGPLFTRERHVAAQRVVRDGGVLRYIDVPAEAMQTLMPSRLDPEKVFVVPRALVEKSEVIDVADPALIQNFRERATVAVAKGREMTAKQNTTTTTTYVTTREQDMPDLNVMNNAFTEMDTSLEQIRQNLPPERLQAFDGLRKKLKVTQAKMLETQTEIETKRGSIEGETYVTPVPHQFAGFVAEKRGEDVRYNQRKADGRVGAIAFTDHGDRVEIGNWRDRETVLAAMQLGAEKWGALTINGTDRYKALAVELAADHGFRLTNPELQDALVAARDRFASQRLKEANISAGTQTPPEAVVAQKANPASAGTPAPETVATPNTGEAAQPAPTFVDVGDKIRLSDRDRAAMLSAMQEAAKKWDTVAVTGSDGGKALAVELAAEHGFRITNPELQEPLKAAQMVVEERRAREEALEQQKLGFVDGAKSAKETKSAQATTASVEVPRLPVDTGDKFKPAGRDRNSMLVAMRAASEKWGPITVNGSDREKTVAVELAAEHGITVSNPELQDQVKAAQAKVEDRRAKEEARERKQLGFVAGTNEAAAAQHTDAEIAIALDTVRESTGTEAVRETRQADLSEHTSERPFDGGGEDHAYRTKAESAAARRAQRAVEQNPATPMPANVNQSPEIERQRQVQDELLSEKEANKQAQATKSRQRPRQKQ